MTKIKQARMKSGMTVLQLAMKVGIDPSSMSRIENGKQQCRARARVEKIAGVLGLELLDVVFNEPEEKAA